MGGWRGDGFYEVASWGKGGGAARWELVELKETAELVTTLCPLTLYNPYMYICFQSVLAKKNVREVCLMKLLRQWKRTQRTRFQRFCLKCSVYLACWSHCNYRCCLCHWNKNRKKKYKIISLSYTKGRCPCPLEAEGSLAAHARLNKWFNIDNSFCNWIGYPIWIFNI